MENVCIEYYIFLCVQYTSVFFPALGYFRNEMEGPVILAKTVWFFLLNAYNIVGEKAEEMYCFDAGAGFTTPE